MTCKHTWYKMYTIDDVTKFYCMHCLKIIKFSNWARIGKSIKMLDEQQEIIEDIKKKMNWEENTTGLTFQDFKFAIKSIYD